MEQKSTLEDLFAENKQLRKELDNALKALGLARDRLIEAQEELRRIKWYLVSLEEAKGA
jgi:peptidoglycan hydrolase CwlO-like protein